MSPLRYPRSLFRSAVAALALPLLLLGTVPAAADEVLYIYRSGSARGGTVAIVGDEIHFKVGCNHQSEAATYELGRVSSVRIGPACRSQRFAPISGAYNATIGRVVRWIATPQDGRQDDVLTGLGPGDVARICGLSRGGGNYLWRVVADDNRRLVATRISFQQQELLADSARISRVEVRRIEPFHRSRLCRTLDEVEAQQAALDNSTEAMHGRAVALAVTTAPPP